MCVRFGHYILPKVWKFAVDVLKFFDWISLLFKSPFFPMFCLEDEAFGLLSVTRLWHPADFISSTTRIPSLEQDV